MRWGSDSKFIMLRRNGWIYRGLDVFDIELNRFFVMASVIMAPNSTVVLSNNDDAASSGNGVID